MIILNKEWQCITITRNMPMKIHIGARRRRRRSTSLRVARFLNTVHGYPRDTLHIWNGERRKDFRRNGLLVLLLRLIQCFLSLCKAFRSKFLLLCLYPCFLFFFESISHGCGRLATDNGAWGINVVSISRAGQYLEISQKSFAWTDRRRRSVHCLLDHPRSSAYWLISSKAGPSWEPSSLP